MSDVEILPPLKDWLRPKYRRFFDEYYPDHVAVRYKEDESSDLYDLIHDDPPIEGSWIWHNMRWVIVPRDYLDSLLSRIHDKSRITIREIRKEYRS